MIFPAARQAIVALAHCLVSTPVNDRCRGFGMRLCEPESDVSLEKSPVHIDVFRMAQFVHVIARRKDSSMPLADSIFGILRLVVTVIVRDTTQILQRYS